MLGRPHARDRGVAVRPVSRMDGTHQSAGMGRARPLLGREASRLVEPTRAPDLTPQRELQARAHSARSGDGTVILCSELPRVRRWIRHARAETAFGWVSDVRPGLRRSPGRAEGCHLIGWRSFLMSRPAVNSPFNRAANSSALRTVRGVVKAARSTLIAPCRVASSKSPASAATITCWSRSVNRGALGRPFGLPD
jgi:hypothetical protein